MGVSHIPATAIHLHGTYVRQRCAWCGVIIIDQDLTRVAYQIVEGEEQRPFPVWDVSQLVRIDGNVLSAVPIGENEKLPDDCCALLPPELTETVGEKR